MKDKFSKFSLPLLWFFATLVIIFMMTFTVNAESGPNSLPYIVANENISGYNDFVNGLRYNGGYSWAVSQIDNDNFFGYDYYEGGYHKFCFYFPSDDFVYSFVLSDDYDSFDITSDSCQMTIRNYQSISGRIETYNGRYYFYGAANYNKFTTDYTITFFQNSNKGDGTALVPNISSQNYVYNDDEYSVVFGFGNPERPIIPTGHATPPGEFDSPLYNTGHAQPVQVPNTPSINNYSWTTHNNPPIDTTNLDSLVSSLIDIVVYNFNYLFTNLAGLFNNLISNIASLFSYIGQVIEYYGNLIISNLQNLITTFYNNMVSLVESISETITYITEPFNSALINTAFTSTNFYGVKTQFVNTFTTFDNAFDITEPDSFTIIFNVQNITPFYNLGVTSPVIVDLGSNFLPIRAALRTFLWVLVAFGSVFVVEHGLSNWIRGERQT